MSHDRDMVDQDLEEVAEELWTLEEEDRHRLEDLRGSSQVARLEEALNAMLERGLIRIEEELVALTPRGRELAERQVRRHRLAEMLFTAALHVDDDHAVNRTACVMEHVLDAAMTDSVCAFLGHPRHCPHGKPIPPGTCCKDGKHRFQSVIMALSEMKKGQKGKIAYVHTSDREMLRKIMAMGALPGLAVTLLQQFPSPVFQIGESQFAVDKELADRIRVWVRDTN